MGEFFKAQQRLTNILAVYFLGVFDAPSAFLSLGHSLENLLEEIDRLFDENSNPNSSILRPDNRLNVQQMLRVTSHGVLDAVEELENLLNSLDASQARQGGSTAGFLTALQPFGIEQMAVSLRTKFDFLAWKLKLFFRALRK